MSQLLENDAQQQKDDKCPVFEQIIARILLHVSNDRLMYANVQTDKSISTLKNLFTTKDLIYVFNGVTLNPKYSFHFYGITTDDCIMVYPENPNENVQKINGIKWTAMNYINDDDVFKRIFRKKISIESGRLHDIKFDQAFNKKRKVMKIEKLFRNTIANLNENQNDEKKEIHTNLSYDPLSDPSKEPLPLLW